MSEQKPFSLPKNLVHASATDLAAGLKEYKGRKLEIEADEVEYLGAQCLQVLIAAARQWKEDGCEFEIVKRSSEFDECTSRFGLDATNLSRGEVLA